MKRLKLYSALSVTVLVVGLVLLGYMIVVEDEPGALPLALVVFGTLWQVYLRMQIRKHRQHS